jgi:hypothetical protein
MVGKYQRPIAYDTARLFQHKGTFWDQAKL